MTTTDGAAPRLTDNQETIVRALQRWKAREQGGATVAELHHFLRGRLSGDAIRSNLARLRTKGLVWSYGSTMTNATCWHPDPPIGLAHPALAERETIDG